jgi:hypothetical protein
MFKNLKFYLRQNGSYYFLCTKQMSNGGIRFEYVQKKVEK